MARIHLVEQHLKAALTPAWDSTGPQNNTAVGYTTRYQPKSCLPQKMPKDWCCVVVFPLQTCRAIHLSAIQCTVFAGIEMYVLWCTDKNRRHEPQDLSNAHGRGCAISLQALRASQTATHISQIGLFSRTEGVLTLSFPPEPSGEHVWTL